MTEARRLLERVTRMAYRVGSDEETLINEVEACLAQPMTTCEDVAAREAVLMGALRELRESVHSHSGLGDRHTHDPDTCPVYSEQGCWYCQRAPCRYICPKIDAALAGTSPAAAALLAREGELVVALGGICEFAGRAAGGDLQGLDLPTAWLTVSENAARALAQGKKA